MLEVCFSDSVKGALALAQHCDRDKIGGAIGFITDLKGPAAWLAKGKALGEYKKSQKELAKIAVPLGGRQEEIAGLSFGLSEGDIQAPILPGECPRKEYLRQWLAFDPYHELEGLEETVETFWSACLADLEKVKAAPPRLRAWVDHTPDARCGLMFLANLLEGTETEIHLVELPRTVTREDDCVVEYRSWGEVEPQRFGAFLDRERVMTREELISIQNLVEDTFLRDNVVQYIVALSGATRNSPDILRGASPRATLSVTAMSKAVARLRGRDYVIPGDVKEVFVHTVAHRLILSPRAEAQGKTAEQILQGLLETVPAPRMR